jgi:hypothetical protein
MSTKHRKQTFASLLFFSAMTGALSHGAIHFSLSAALVCARNANGKYLMVCAMIPESIIAALNIQAQY